MTLRRRFTSVSKEGTVVELAIKKPNQIIMNEADLHYNVNLNKAIRLGSMTRTEALAMIEERGLWTKEDDAKLNEIRKKIADKETKLNDPSLDKYVGIGIAKDLKKDRASLVSHLNKRQSYILNTAEYYAENIRDQFLAASCTIVADTEEKYFKSFDDYLMRSDEVVTTDAYREMVYFLNGYDALEHNNFAENKYLIANEAMTEDGFFIDEKGRKMTQDGKLINDKYQYVDEEGNRIDEFGNKIEVPQSENDEGKSGPEEKPKTRGRPKKN